LIFCRAHLIWRANPETKPSEAMADEPATMPNPDVTADKPVEGTAAEAAAPQDDRATALAAEVAGLKDKLLRTLAEQENLRRRTEREVSDSRQYAVTSFAREMLVVADNLRRAIQAVPAEARATDPALANLMDGVDATERGLEQTLAKFGVRQISPKGEKFDPGFHQAMYELETADSPPGTVTDVIQPGYVIGERVLRPALVAIAKASRPPANDNPPAETAEPADAAEPAEAKSES
jgi:molecular chaperone GrpE